VQLLNKIAASPAVGQHATSRVRAAVTAFFAFDGFIFATWAVRIPAVKAATGASPAELGVALLGVSGGAIATMALSGLLCRQFGAVRVLICGSAWLSLAVLLPALARSALGLGLGLVVFGIGYGCVNVASNTVAVDVVAVLRRPVMPSFHGAWSLGGLAGAALGGLLAPHLTPLPHFAIAAALGLAVTVVAGRVLVTTRLPAPEGAATLAGAATPEGRPKRDVPIDVRAEIGPQTLEAAVVGPDTAPQAAAQPTAPRAAANASPRSHPWRVVLLLGVLAACSTYGEGSVTDWGALRLHGLGAGVGLAAAGYAAFALAEACGRLAGTWLLARFGQRTVLVAGGIATCAGMLAAALAPSIPVVVAGFALAGLGVANAFPAAMTRVGLLAGPHGVAIASTLGYGGFLLGPPTIGFLAGTIGLGPSLATVSLLAVVAVAIAWFVTAEARSGSAPARQRTP
jgi:MFS family permease